jgi:hypothetical protein
MTIMAASAVLDVACWSPFACVNLYGSIKLLSELSPLTAGEGEENRFREKRNELTRTMMLLHVKPVRALSGKKRTLCVVYA